MVINVSGDLSGRFNLIYITPNTASIPISSYNDFIYNIATLDLNKNVITYRPLNFTNPFTTFEQNQYYLVFCKKNFNLNVADYYQDKFVLSGTDEGNPSFFKFPFDTTVPLSSFSSKFKFLREVTSDGGTFTTYLSGRYINPVKTFKKNRTYYIETVKDFVIYNRDFSALQQEQLNQQELQDGEGWILLEGDLDRLLLEQN